MLEKTFESPLDSKEINQSILKELNLEYSLKVLMLKLQYFGQLMLRAGSLEKTLTLRKAEGRRRRGRQRMRWWRGIVDTADTSLSKLRDVMKDREAWCVAVHAELGTTAYFPVFTCIISLLLIIESLPSNGTLKNLRGWLICNVNGRITKTRLYMYV